MFKPTTAKTPAEYINMIMDPVRRAEVKKLDAFIRKLVPKLKPRILSGMIGYGSYHYKSTSGREGDWSIIALASQKNYISVYICAIKDGRYIAEVYKKELGKVNVGKSCIRFKHLADLNVTTLKTVIREAVRHPMGLVSH